MLHAAGVVSKGREAAEKGAESGGDKPGDRRRKATQIAPCQSHTTNGTKIRKKCTIIVKIRTKLNYVTEKFINFAVSKNFLTAVGFLQRRV